MSFEVKYDEKGNVVSPPPVVEEPEVVEDVVEELPDPAYADATQATEATEQKFNKPEMDKSWAELRRKAESAERERDELRRALEARNQTNEPEEDLSINVNDDDLVEGRTVSKVDKKLRKLEEKLQQYEYNAYQTSIQNRLISEYPDFNDVVSLDNVNRLKEEYPQIFNTLRAGNDIYSQGVSAYTMIKKFGIAPDDGMSQIRSRIDKNIAKPRSVATIASQKGDTPLAKANPFSEGLTEDLKAALLKEMNAAARKY